MSTFRVIKDKNYTVMSNHHLRDINLSMKAKGLLSVMLSLPEKWDYSLHGLACICKEGIDAVRTVVNELEAAGYIVRSRKRNSKGQRTACEYTVYEVPMQAEPTLEKPILDNPTQDKPTQINKELSNKDKLNTAAIKYPSINLQSDEFDGTIDEYNKNIELVKDNIGYECFSGNDKQLVDEIVEIMAEVLTMDTPYYTIENKQYPSEMVKQRLLNVDYSKLEAFLLDFNRRNKKIHNMKAYMITSLFNMPATADGVLSNMVRNDLYEW